MPAKEHAIKSDLARIDKLRDEDIDYSDIPELDDEVFAQPLVPWPPRKEPITSATTRLSVRNLPRISRSSFGLRYPDTTAGWCRSS